MSGPARTAMRAAARDLDVEVVVVGAGAAGLACAGRLRADGRSTLVLEASGLVGGRARTSHPAFLAGEWLDEGASWLHAVERNPLVPLARAAGEALGPAWAGRGRSLFVDGRLATAAEEAGYEAAEARWQARLGDAASGGRDTSVAEAAGALRHRDPWAANVENWECSVIAAADAERLGVADWHANRLPEGDLLPAAGVGRLVRMLLGPGAGEIRLDTAVRLIDRRPAGHVAVHTDAGVVRAGAVVVTVSTGVLASGAIRFSPPLPDAQADAIARLPMGLLSKVALRLRDAAPPGWPEGEALLERRLRAPGEAMMIFGLRPRGTDQVLGYVGGPGARAIASDARAAEDFARAELGSMLGRSALGALLPGAFATGWGTDPLFLGSYAYAGPGDRAARGVLGAPVEGGRLVLAGEACREDGLAGTVGGAVRDGWRAAGLAAGALGARFPSSAGSR